MSQEITKQDPKLLQQWQDRSGAKGRSKVNQIIFVNTAFLSGETVMTKDPDTGEETEMPKPNPDFGKLFAVSYDLEGEEAERERIDIKTAVFFLAKVRIQIKSKKVDANKKPLFWMREISSLDDLIQVRDPDGKTVAEGLYQELKPTYDLKYADAAYVYYKGKVYRWVITGAHFETWFPLKNKAQKRPYTFKIHSIVNAPTDGAPFKTINFELGEPFPLEEAIKVLDQIDINLAKYYRSVQEKTVTPAQVEDIDYETDLPFPTKD